MADSLTASEVRLIHDADSVQLRLQLHLPDRRSIGKKDLVLVYPRLVNGADSLDLPSVGVYGRIPWLFAVRSGIFLFQGTSDVALRSSKIGREGVCAYSRNVAYESWMEGAEVKLVSVRLTCCGDVADTRSYRILRRQEVTYPPYTVYHTRTATATGTSHVDFIVNRIELRRDYHDNWRELDQISRLIDSIQQLPNSHIDTIALHGYASPEGPWRRNVYLARNRVRALARYLADFHQLDPSIISLRSTPEDWAGLRRFVEQSSLPHRDEMLRVIGDTIAEPDPDRRLNILKQQYPDDYQVIWAQSLPYLRHTDYTIHYTLADSVPETVPGRTEAQLPQVEAQPITPAEQFPPLRPLFAVKTNLLLDAALWPNVEAEVPFGRNANWSVMAEWGSPWYVWHHNSRAYQILNVGLEVRRWLGRCYPCRPVLSGGFVGLYAAAGKYDLEWDSNGKQGEYFSAGISGGYSWPVRPCLNIEFSGSVGILFGPQRHYHGEFQDTHLIWKHFDGLIYGGPTQLKVSLVWLLPRKWFGLDRKGGVVWY